MFVQCENSEEVRSCFPETRAMIFSFNLIVNLIDKKDIMVETISLDSLLLSTDVYIVTYHYIPKTSPPIIQAFLNIYCDIVYSDPK